jgi:hypothetical protein
LDVSSDNDGFGTKETKNGRDPNKKKRSYNEIQSKSENKENIPVGWLYFCV